jgi:hypothetical protein
MKTKNELTVKPQPQPLTQASELKEALEVVAKVTSEAQKAAEENPHTPNGTLKSDLKGFCKTTSNLRAEGEEAHKRGIVPKPNMEGGVKNRELNASANTTLKALELLEKPKESIPTEKIELLEIQEEKIPAETVKK